MQIQSLLDDPLDVVSVRNSCEPNKIVGEHVALACDVDDPCRRLIEYRLFWSPKSGTFYQLVLFGRIVLRNGFGR